MNSAIAWFARNSVAANLLMLFVLFAGILTLPSLRLEVFPEPDPSIITVSVEYRGAAPQEVEEGVCIRIEEQLQGLAGVERVTSVANEGVGVVTVEVLPGEDLRAVLDDVKARVDAIDSFPEETEKPVVSQAVFRRAVIDVAISGPTDERALKELAERVRDQILERTPVTLIEMAGARPYEISVEVSEAALRRHGLRFDDVAAAVRRSSLDLPGGSVKTAGGEILLRAKGQAYRGPEFGALPLLTRPDGTRVTLGEVARVVDGFEDQDRWSRFDGQPVTMLQVFRVGNQSSPDLAREVKEYVARAGAELPEGIELTTWQDDSEYFRARLDTLIQNGRWGLLLVLGVLALFMQVRLAFWVMLAIPVCLAGAVFLMPIFDVSVNIVSLFAFILVLGILVDDAIVVGENIYVHRRRGAGGLEAATLGAQEVSVPVVFAVLTSIAAFAPLLVLPGSMGEIFFTLPVVAIACFGFSIVESLFILPAHLGHARLTDGAGGSTRWRRLQEHFSHALDGFVSDVYAPLLERALRHRYLTVSIASALLLWSVGIMAGGWIRFTFFPEVEAQNVVAMLTLPLGTPVEETDAAVRRIEAAAGALRREYEERAEEPQRIIRHVLTSVGENPYRQRQFSGPGGGGARSFAGSHLGEVNLELTPAETRSVGARELARRWRELTGPIPDAVELSFSADRFSAGDAIAVQLRGRDVDELRAVADALELRLAAYEGVYDVTDSFRGGKQELQLRILPSAEALGLSLADLARQVRQAFYGEEAQRIQRGRDDVRVMVRYPEAERRSLGDVWNLRVRTPSGDEVPFGSVAEAELGRGYATIRRADRRRVIDVGAAVDIRRANANEIMADLRATALPELLAAHPRVSYTLEGAQREQSETVGGVFRGFAIALLTIYALLAVPLRSYAQPLLIMSAIPFGLVGALAGHLLLGHQLSMLSLFGMVALSGVVVNSSLVLVEFINRRHRAGADLDTALREGAAARFRPVVLTAATTFVGLLPIMLERSEQAQFLIPMAIALAFGVVFATAITLLVVPCTYRILEDLRAPRDRLRLAAVDAAPRGRESAGRS